MTYLGMIPVLLLLVGLWEQNSRAETSTPGAKTGNQQAGAPAPAGEAPVPASTSPGRIQGRDGAEMVLVPAGEFLMGSPVEEGNNGEHPQHRVYLDAFYIDKYEVTNARYRKCVEAGTCTPPHATTDEYDDPQGADHPVVYVDWEQARAYCSWAGRRLPTEAEWEKAARGTDGRVYPWGNGFGSGHANIDGSEDSYQNMAPVGSFPLGASPYGALDTAGNVWEWVADWYDQDYYASSPSRNPQGPDREQRETQWKYLVNQSGQLAMVGEVQQQLRVLRGGSWDEGQGDARSARRFRLDPDHWFDFIGFRCAQDSR